MGGCCNPTCCKHHHGCHHNHDGLDGRATCRFAHARPVRLVLRGMGMMPVRSVRWVMFLSSRLFWRLVRRLWSPYGMTDRCFAWCLCGMADRHVPCSLHWMTDRRSLPSPLRWI